MENLSHTCAADAEAGSAGAAGESVAGRAFRRRVAGADGDAVWGVARLVGELNDLEHAEHWKREREVD